MSRLPSRPDEVIDRHKSLSFCLERRTLEAYAGDTVASAMAANGVRVTGRSFKYHRPRGLLCMTGSCANCLVTIDGIPNVRACTEPVRDGMVVRRQNYWLSPDRDLLSLADRLSFLLPAGFYYKILHKPRWMWEIAEPLVRALAGLGNVPVGANERPIERIRLFPDVLVVGGGPAGLAVAGEAARAGAKTVLLEERAEVGGHLLPIRPSDVQQLATEAREAGAEIRVSTSVLGSFDGQLLAAASPEALFLVRARRVVFANGAVEQPAVFANNDLPGVMLSGAVERLVALYRVLPGRRVVVLSGTDRAHRVAKMLIDAGATVTIVDLRASPPSGPEGVEVLPGSTVLRAEGRGRVAGVVLGAVEGGSERRIPCDLIVVAGPRIPATSLLAQAGADLVFDEAAQAFLPRALPDWALAAGEAGGVRTLDAILADGRSAGVEAARVGLGAADATAMDRDITARPHGDQETLPPIAGAGRRKQFVCLCMDVTDKELKFAVAEGFDSAELLKRYTTVFMGPCQGRMCALSSQRLCSEATGRAKTAPTTARPPWAPVPLRVLASERRTPRRETSIHDLHLDADAQFVWAGDWRRPNRYGNPEEEVLAVRERVGMIDVSTLGKFRVKGPDAAELLERLYPGRFADQEVGRIRYGVMLNEEGVILDDGVVCRLGEDEFFVTVTTGNTVAVDRWIEWWVEWWGLDVRVLNVTGALAAVNVVGPLARRVMERLATMDLSSDAFPYLAAARGTVADVPALVLRIGFIGELGYEIHFPSGYGEHVWNRVLEAGADHGIRPFGLEAQRIMRLEKRHMLVGQDTDAESGPYEAGLGWMPKLDKPDFLGKRALMAARERPARSRLVGFVAEGDRVPPEGSAFVENGRWVGRVTSCRKSPVIGAVIGMGWVPDHLAAEGKRIWIAFDGGGSAAAVALRSFYDPEGARVRS